MKRSFGGWIGGVLAGCLFLSCLHGHRWSLPERIDEYMQRVAARGFSGALLVAKGQQIILAKGYGFADRERKLPVTPRTVFTVGSITKQFTAAAILKLYELGKLDLRDPIDRYFPNVPPDKAGITLHHLLTHTAGFPDAIGDDFEPISREEFVALALRTPLLFLPGERYHYSNVGYSLLGAIIEQLTDTSYERFLHDALFVPAGMKETGYVLPAWREGQLAHGYRGARDWGTLRDHRWASDGPYWHLRANGGILSTIGDLYKWHVALESGRVLPDTLRDLLYRPYVREGPEANSFYGYGWALFTTSRGTRLVAHNGGNGIFSADFLRFLDEDVVVICLANVAGKPAWQASETAARIVFGEPYELPAEKVEALPLPLRGASPMEGHALALLRLLNQGDTTAVAEVLEAHFAPAYQQPERLARLRSFVQRVGSRQAPLTVVQAEKVGDTSLELTLRSEKTGDWWLLTVDFAEDSLHRITGMRMVDTAPLEGP
ncbi:MAG: beta-lactamase family protein [candidate division KSB1 bacterium]|nr:beta-lactamase family protein [candidate division KSB1 bacterium]